MKKTSILLLILRAVTEVWLKVKRLGAEGIRIRKEINSKVMIVDEEIHHR